MSDETIPQMRDRIDKQNAEIRELRSDNRKYLARESFRDAGLKPEFGDLFAAQADEKTEINTDTAKAFAEQYGLAVSDAPVESEVEEAPAEEESGEPAGAELASMSSGGTSAGEGGAAATGNTMTRDEWVDLQKTDPVAAQRALMQGRVQLREDNFYVQNGLVPNR